MRELDHIDLLVICAEAVTEPQGVNLMHWWGHSEPTMFGHPSVQWYCTKHGPFVSVMATNRNWVRDLK